MPPARRRPTPVRRTRKDRHRRGGAPWDCSHCARGVPRPVPGRVGCCHPVCRWGCHAGSRQWRRHSSRDRIPPTPARWSVGTWPSTAPRSRTPWPGCAGRGARCGAATRRTTPPRRCSSAGARRRCPTSTRMSCEDPMTGLATRVHVRSRLGDLYRQHGAADVNTAWALVVCELTGEAPAERGARRRPPARPVPAALPRGRGGPDGLRRGRDRRPAGAAPGGRRGEPR